MQIQVIVAAVVALVLELSLTVSGKSPFLERIVNGVPAEPKQLPYQVVFDVLHKTRGWEPSCGGVIISRRIILTAAHCVPPEVTHLGILLGAVNKGILTEKGQQAIILSRDRVIVHRDYIEFDSESWIVINDIALIKLPMDLQFDEHIQPAALPSRKQDYANKPAVTSGWGLVKFDTTNPNTTEILQLTNVTIMSNEDCKEFFHKYIPRKIFTSSFVCIAPGNSTPCNGDSGGPLVLQDGKNTLIGLTSHGFGGCPLNAPVIFTRVSSYLDWIKENSHLKYFN